MATQNKPFDHSPMSNGSNSIKKNMPYKTQKSVGVKSREDEEENLEQYIEMLQDHQRTCEREGRYVEAEMAKNKLIELKKKFEIQRKDDVKYRHINEKAQLEQEHISEFKEFNLFWDQKMIEFTEQAQAFEEQTILKHQAEMLKFLEEIELSIPHRPKDSPELLNLRKIEQSLAKKKEYAEAHKIQQRCLKLEKEELDRYTPLREKKILSQKVQLEQKQLNELNALRKRISSGQDEQRKARSLELERLLQKYQNVRKELEAQQQLELLRVTPSKATGSLFKSQGSRLSRSNSEMGSPSSQYGGLDSSLRKR